MTNVWQLVLVPHVGIPPLLSGMPKGDVHQVVGEPDRDFGPLTRHGFISLSCDNVGTLKTTSITWNPGDRAVLYNGHSIFELPAEEMVRMIAQDATPSWEEDGSGVTFYDLDLQFWRPELPGPHVWEDDEYRGGRFWMESCRPKADSVTSCRIRQSAPCTSTA